MSVCLTVCQSTSFLLQAMKFSWLFKASPTTLEDGGRELMAPLVWRSRWPCSDTHCAFELPTGSSHFMNPLLTSGAITGLPAYWSHRSLSIDFSGKSRHLIILHRCRQTSLAQAAFVRGQARPNQAAWLSLERPSVPSAVVAVW